ncbi:MAG TPA: YCF48-related protein [Saprospiraceae bacterium]|nr:YCF48-related protein [Saprospiraceae bacterium]
MKRLFTLLALLTCTLALYSQEWVRQHPFAGFAPLHAITFDDNGNGWAVGQQSLILHTNDWGEIWTLQSDLPIGYTFEAVEIIPGTGAQTLLVGGPGLFRTDDGGETWDFVFIGQTLDGVYRIRAFDEMNWIAMGLSTFARTTNGGMDWEVLAMPDNSAFAADFTDMNNGWAGSGPFDAYQVYKTTNGGMDWNLADDDIYPIITDIEMINTQVGFLSGRDHMYKSTNGGADWEKLHDDVQPSINGIHAVNEDIVWCTLNNGFVFFTLNGGADWEQINPNLINSNQVFDLFATEDGRVWLPGKYASIQYTMNNGQSWEEQTPGSKNSLFDVEFDANTGFAIGSEGTILRTTNGGAIWENFDLDPLETFLGMALLNVGGTRHVYIGSNSGKVYHSTNDGEDWDMIGQGLGQIRCLYARSTQEIVVGTESNIQVTQNGGQNWIPSSVVLGNLVQEIVFGDNLTGYATVHDGRILKSVDGGITWNPVLQRDNSYRFSGVHFNNAMQGWAVAEFKDSVWTTQNGGASWNAYRLPYNTFWQDVTFMDADTGYISGGSAGSGTILRTVDGGETWTFSFFESERLNNTYVRPGEDFVWVVGFGGNILHFSPCALTPEISDLTGDVNPCEGEISIYEVNSSGATVFTWTVPAGWTIIGNDNSARVEVLVGSGNGEITIQAANSCGIQTTKLSIDVSSILGGAVSITELSGTLSTDLQGVTYQWLRDEGEIPGATNSSYTPTMTGTYALVVTFPNGCTAISNEIFVMISGLRDVQQKQLQVSPNPAGEVINLQGDFNGHVVSIMIYDSNGRIISCADNGSMQIDVSDLASGVYQIQLITADDVFIGRFVRR